MQDIIKDFNRLKEERSNWNPLWQVLGEYVSLNKQNFEATPDVGEFLTDEIYDSTGVFAAQSSASALLGMLWPGSAKQVLELAPPDGVEIDTELAEFYQRMTDRTVYYMDDPKANLSLALDEYMLDQVIFGTSGVGAEAVEPRGIMVKPYGVKEIYIEEGRNGKVAEIYIFYEWRIPRVVEEYGIENVSEKVRQGHETGSTDKIKILVCMRKRKEKKAEKGMLAMDYESVHLEYENDNQLKEEGFNELPIFVGRFRKINYERYGRSPAMNALPDIKEANVLREAVIVATEKNLDPPLVVMDDGSLGGGVIDTSARAINVFNSTGAVGNKGPISPLMTVGSLTDALARLEKLEETISRHFFIDRLLDMNNDQQMTFGEAQIRNQIRNSSLSSLFSRQIAEVFTPLIERCVRILWRQGVFGVVAGSIEEQEAIEEGREVEYIPDSLVEMLEKGEEIFTIRYKTAASNAARAQEYMAILDIIQLAMQTAQMNPNVLKRVDMEEALKAVGEIRGLPVGIIREDDEVEAMIAAEQKQQEEQMMMQAAPQLASAAKDAATAEKIANE